tara:strand:+ start:364 stop:699 length:336 start_codon:yes stop_codon:yes gene_type:complete
MPYISKNRRNDLDFHVADLVSELHTKGTGYGAKKPGELNYVITKLILGYLYQKKNQEIVHSPRYTDMNEVMGVLECVRTEFYRKEVAPYEDEKAELNGDVFPGQDKRDPSA